MDEMPDVLTQSEIETIIRGYLQMQGKRGATRDQIEDVVERVREMRIDGKLADIICQGKALFDGKTLVANPVGTDTPVTE